MIQKDNINSKVILVGMNEAAISTDERHIIGTDALATCVGVLLYNPEKKIAIVAHSSSEYETIIYQILDIIRENNFDSSIIQYKVFSGYYYNHYDIKNKLETIFKSFFPLFVPLDENKIPKNAIMKNPELECNRFAFDAKTGNFVTDKISFNYEEKRKVF